MRRRDYFGKLALTTIIKATYDLLCTWYPAADLIEGTKFAKFAREFGLVGGNVKNNDIDLGFTKAKGKNERRIDAKGFGVAVRYIAGLKFASRIRLDEKHALHMSEDDAYERILWEHLAMHPPVNEKLWGSAKCCHAGRGRDQCGAMAIQSMVRMAITRAWYKMHLQAVIRIEARYRVYRARCGTSRCSLSSPRRRTSASSTYKQP